MTSSRLGAWAAATMCLIGAAYLVTLSCGVAIQGLNEPIADPVLAVMEVLTLMSAPPMVVMMAAIHQRASVGHKIWSEVALAFTILFAGTTSTVHFVELTAIRQSGPGGIAWPSSAYAAELLAWDWFLGLALLFAAPVFANGGRERAVRIGLLVSGLLCIAGTVGPAIGNMRLQLIGVFGYALVLPVVCFLLARVLRRDDAAVPGAT
jgi:hypothetical protein